MGTGNDLNQQLACKRYQSSFLAIFDTLKESFGLKTTLIVKSDPVEKNCSICHTYPGL